MWEIASVRPPSFPFTQVGHEIRNSGDGAALELLTARVYNELRAMARPYMRSERPGNTLRTTSLVNEAYLRLVDVPSTFGGLSVEQSAEGIRVSERTVMRDWDFAKVLVSRELSR